MSGPTSARAYRARVGFGRTIRPYSERLASARALDAPDAEAVARRDGAVARLRKAGGRLPDRQDWHRRKMAQNLKGKP